LLLLTRALLEELPHQLPLVLLDLGDEGVFDLQHLHCEVVELIDPLVQYLAETGDREIRASMVVFALETGRLTAQERILAVRVDAQTCHSVPLGALLLGVLDLLEQFVGHFLKHHYLYAVKNTNCINIQFSTSIGAT
jgi:hypothetical protein